MEKCPFCMREIADGASVCQGCGAQKGYTQAQGIIYGREQTILFGILIPGALALFILIREGSYIFNKYNELKK